MSYADHAKKLGEAVGAGLVSPEDAARQLSMTAQGDLTEAGAADMITSANAPYPASVSDDSSASPR